MLVSATTAECGYKDWPGLSAMHDGHLCSAAFVGEVAHHFAYEGFSKNSAGHYSREGRQYCVHRPSRKICQIGVFFWHASCDRVFTASQLVKHVLAWIDSTAWQVPGEPASTHLVILNLYSILRIKYKNQAFCRNNAGPYQASLAHSCSNLLKSGSVTRMRDANVPASCRLHVLLVVAYGWCSAAFDFDLAVYFKFNKFSKFLLTAMSK